MMSEKEIAYITEPKEIEELDTDTLKLILLAAMFVVGHVNENTVRAAAEYARRLIALNEDVPAWVGALRGVTAECHREKAAEWAGQEFKSWPEPWCPPE